MKFSKVKLKEHGLHGVEADYTQFEEVQGISFENQISRKRKAPAHKELKDAFKSLSYHIMMICGFDSNIEGEIETTAVHSNGDDQFILTGTVRCLNNAFFAVNTPLVKEISGYAAFGEVMSIIKNIYKEAALYFNKKKIESNKQTLIEFTEYQQQKGEEVKFTTEEIQKMEEGDENLRNLMIEALERKGCMVLRQEDHSKEVAENKAA